LRQELSKLWLWLRELWLRPARAEPPLPPAQYGRDRDAGAILHCQIQCERRRGCRRFFLRRLEAEHQYRVLQEVEGRPPISNRPESSVTVVILSVPHSAVTVAQGSLVPRAYDARLHVSSGYSSENQ